MLCLVANGAVKNSASLASHQHCDKFWLQDARLISRLQRFDNCSKLACASADTWDSSTHLFLDVSNTHAFHLNIGHLCFDLTLSFEALHLLLPLGVLVKRLLAVKSCSCVDVL